MKLIAHRGASKVFPENSIEGLIYGAKLGAYAVECDVRMTKDGRYVIYHDDNLSRFTNTSLSVSETTYQDMKEILQGCGMALMTLEELIKWYNEKTPVLLHIKMDYVANEFINIIKNSTVDFICGVTSVKALDAVGEFFKPNRCLAFMKSYNDYDVYAKNGAGIIRIWENWLDKITPLEIKKRYDVEVWIMSYKENSFNGDEDSLNKFVELNADGVLLDDIELGMRWKEKHKF